jgi:hypothetical protein
MPVRVDKTGSKNIHDMNSAMPLRVGKTGSPGVGQVNWRRIVLQTALESAVKYRVLA